MADFDYTLNHSGVSGNRVASRLNELSLIGKTEYGGSYRVGFSAKEAEAKNKVIDWMKEAGLAVTTDGAGNVFGRLEGKNQSLPLLMSGSHVDSVPNGGHFDGPLGVLAALEVVEAWKETGYTPERTVEVVIFTDEEGARFNGGLLGSQAFTGQNDKETITKLTDTEGKSFSEVLDEIGLTEEEFFQSERDLTKIEAFIEVHIEQGKRLEKEQLPVGIVTGIAGPCWLSMNFKGQAGHAGNTPMDERCDALVAAGKFVSEIHNLPPRVSSTAVATVGKLNVKPNGVNVIPGEVDLTVDIRDIHENTRDQLVGLITDAAQSVAKKYGINVAWNETVRVDPLLIRKDLQQKLDASIVANGIEPFYLPSGAGHDAMVVGRKIPSAMLFVQSKDGISHNPAEWSSLNDCVQTIHVLKHFIENY
ncbi:M20 family metallo-hydrolase [Salirhabdus salicampi]|uniref:M20 family metallo-hydrolase n=1 Tax=Salirhabdus salicampi TaxID=476102 RepID=UPI0020C382E2|nr:M20 family metallo-hydrolase [Salirhabdus salicampi]MCP8617884.1 M20 family metallo-hydrolase [Salirhabdus salicampi]